MSDYKSYRSDMGCQCYELKVMRENGDLLLSYIGSYFIGSNQKDEVINSFKSEIEQALNSKEVPDE